MKNKKEQWADEVMNSLTHLEKAEPDDQLFARITAQLPRTKLAKVIPLNRLVWIATAACVAIAINIYVLSTKMKSDQNELTANIGLLSDYSIYE